MAWKCTAASGMGPLVFTGIYWYLLMIQPNAAKPIRPGFTVQMDNDLEDAAKAKQEFLRDINVLQSQSQSHDLNSMEHAFQLLKDPQTTGFEGGCCKGLSEHPKGRLFAMSKNDFRHRSFI